MPTMEFSGTADIGAGREVVWRRVVDPHFVAKSMPGIESIETVAPGRYRIAAAIGVGPMQLKTGIDLEIFDLVEPEQARLRASASASGSAADVLSAVRLEESGGGRTLLHWSATTGLQGPLAALGAGLMEGVARKLTADFWADFARRVEAEA
jgi:carbon monoxide dehydrogenase subunit G